MRIAIRKRKRPDSAHALRESVERQLSFAVDAGMPRRGDPLYYVAESFQREFRDIGVKRSEGKPEREDAPDETEASEKRREAEAQEQEDMKESQKREKPDEEKRIGGAPMKEFSQMAFERGELSAAVLQGTGKMALISCLKRSAGQPEQSATLFGLGAQTRNVPARDPDQMMFHRNFAQSAVGLVVDTLRDARQTVDSLREMAMGTEGFRVQDGGATLRTMYPFLDDSRERALLDERRERLKGDCTPEERAILENAAVRAEALIAKKARMKEEFIQRLREISDRATQALEELERPETVEEAAQALSETEAPNPPPDEAAPSAPETERSGAADTESVGEAETPSGGTESETA